MKKLHEKLTMYFDSLNINQNSNYYFTYNSNTQSLYAHSKGHYFSFVFIEELYKFCKKNKLSFSIDTKENKIIINQFQF